jgi:hypothetical protein
MRLGIHIRKRCPRLRAMMRVQCQIALAAVLWTLCASASPPGPHAAAQVCFTRLGENGSLNVLPVSIRVGTQAGAYFSPEAFGVFTVLGEEEVCLKPLAFSPAKVAVTLRFPHPWQAFKKKQDYWTTAPVWIWIKPGITTDVLLCPRILTPNADPNWDTVGWHRLWVLSPPEARRACYSDRPH